jgi:hypothetical protein
MFIDLKPAKEVDRVECRPRDDKMVCKLMGIAGLVDQETEFEEATVLNDFDKCKTEDRGTDGPRRTLYCFRD